LKDPLLLLPLRQKQRKAILSKLDNYGSIYIDSNLYALVKPLLFLKKFAFAAKAKVRAKVKSKGRANLHFYN